jgi:hypothetical protein
MLLLALQVASGIRPDLSPGQTTPTTQAVICAKPWQADNPARIGNALWSTVLTTYGVAWTDRGLYQAATVVPTAFGGVISAANLAPLPKGSTWNLARKQQVEHKVYDELCAGRLHAPEAQVKAGVGWLDAWRGYFAP